MRPTDRVAAPADLAATLAGVRALLLDHGDDAEVFPVRPVCVTQN